MTAPTAPTSEADGRPRSGSRLRSVPADASSEEVAAIVAAVAELHRRHAAVAVSAVEPDADRLSHWRASARLFNRRLGMTRGPWRLSGRLTRRSRA